MGFEVTRDGTLALSRVTAPACGCSIVSVDVNPQRPVSIPVEPFVVSIGTATSIADIAAGAPRMAPDQRRSIDMANFLLTFHGGSMPETDEAQDQVMKAWTDWFGALGDALVDGGNPISHSKAISPDGSVMDAATAPTGYSIIKAGDLDGAVALAKGCPVLADGAVVLVSETFPVM